MATLLTCLLLFPGDNSENVAELLEKAKPGNPKEVRIEALKQIQDAELDDPRMVIRALGPYGEEKDLDIRLNAVLALGSIAYDAKLECPLPVVKAAFDEDETIRTNAAAYALLCERLPQSALDLVLKAAKSKVPIMRESAAELLPKFTAKRELALKMLRALTNDPDEFVRHNAHVFHFKATKDRAYYVPYLLAYSSDLNPAHPTKTEEQKRDQARRELTKLGIAIFFYDLTKDRPKELAEELILNLSHEKAAVRQCALRQLRAMAISSQESYRAIPKEKAMKAVAELFDDKNEKVQGWAYWVHSILEEGPPNGTPEKLKPLELNTDPEADLDKTEDREH